MTKPDGRQKRFVLPENPEQGAAGVDSPAAKPKARQAQTLHPDKRPRAANPPKVSSEGPAVNLLAVANQAKAAVEKPINPAPLTILNALGPITKPMPAARPIAATSSKAGAPAQPAQVASQSSAGPAQATVARAIGPMPAFAVSPKVAGGARVLPPAQPQSLATQAVAAMTPGAKSPAEQAAAGVLSSRDQQTSDLSGGVANPSGPATSATGRAASIQATMAAGSPTIPAGAGPDASTTAKATAVSRNAAAVALTSRARQAFAQDGVAAKPSGPAMSATGRAASIQATTAAGNPTIPAGAGLDASTTVKAVAVSRNAPPLAPEATGVLTSRDQQTSDLSGGVANPSGPATSATGRAASIQATTAAGSPTIPAGAGLNASTAAKAVAVSRNAAASAPAEVASQPSYPQVRQAGQQPLSGLAQHITESAGSDKSAAGRDSTTLAGAKALAQLEQTQKARGVSLPEATRPGQTQPADATSVLAGSWGHVRGDPSVHAADQPVGKPAPAATPRPAEQIIENIRQAVQNGQREVTINLNPPELGRIRMRMYTQGDEIHGRLEVENPHSFHEIRQQTELLTQRLVGEGIPLRRLDVHMSPTAGQTASFSSPQHDGAGQGTWGQPGDGKGAADLGRDHQLIEASDAGPARAAAEVGVGDSFSGEGLNVWI